MFLRTLTQKIIVSFLIVSLAGIALVAAITRLTSIREFDNLLVNQAKSQLADLASSYYGTYATWEGFGAVVRQDFQDLIQPRQGFPDPAPGSEAARRPSPIILVNLDGKVEFPVGGSWEREFVSQAALRAGAEVVVDGETVGFVIASGEQPGRDAFQEQFVRRTTRYLLLAGAGAALLALILGAVLTQSLTRPLRELKAATQAMSQGQLGLQVPIHTRDELGELAEAFNSMSAKLAHENQLRRQMTADIAHDLRTPLAVLSGYIEAMRDGVLKPLPERFDTMFHEMEHLKHLVEDLRTLSLADAGELPLQPQLVQAADLLGRAQEFFRHPAALQGVELSVHVAQDLPDLRIDIERMVQVMDNIISNALRYSRPGGTIALRAAAQAGGVVLIVQDNGQGISAEDLPHIFNRFYRGDQARSADRDESGLGLAIARAIVQAHGGEITVESTLGQGTTFTIYLPARG